jgi:uncharacterized sulfatase
MTGRSLLPLLLSSRSGEIDPARDAAVSGIERHFPGSRPNGAGYPSRAIRTREYLYIRNYTPDRSPVGDRPGPVWPDDDPVGGFGDTDGGPSKTCLWENREKYPDLYRLAFEKRPSEELYLIPTDRCQLRSVAGDPKHATAKTRLSERLQKYLERMQDPRATGKGELLDAVTQKYPSLGSNR